MPLKSIGNMISEFIKLESAGGILLFIAAVIAMIIVNSPLDHYYEVFIHTHLTIKIGAYGLDETIHYWINDGLMAIFFFLVGMEIKREFIEGELSTRESAILPAIAAVGGMIVPAIIYVFFNWDHANSLRGWAIPTATDIAFALGLIALLGRRVPVSIKVFLTALAILDDLGAILIIAIFYTDQIHYIALFVGLICTILLFYMNYKKVTAFSVYGILGIILWSAILQSGIHATLGGVILALAIPLHDTKNQNRSPLRELEHAIHPWVAFLILPLFAFANAGVSLAGLHIDALLHEVPLGITLGLFFGKQFGVFAACWLCIKAGFAKLPQNATYAHVYGVAILCGIGFTMSLFIGGLAFKGMNDYAAFVRIGVFAGSIASGVFGYLWLLILSKKKTSDVSEKINKSVSNFNKTDCQKG